MRTTKTITVSMTPEQLSQAKRQAAAENRTMSELVREALRRYRQERFWERVGVHRLRMEALGIEEKDVVRIIHEWRAEQRKKKASKPSAR